MNKIAFIFLIYNVINHEELWYMFFSNIDKSQYSIYIHYKYDERLEFLEEFKVAKNIPTKYADISIVNAQNYMLSEALKDKTLQDESKRFVGGRTDFLGLGQPAKAMTRNGSKIQRTSRNNQIGYSFNYKGKVSYSRPKIVDTISIA